MQRFTSGVAPPVTLDFKSTSHHVTLLKSKSTLDVLEAREATEDRRLAMLYVLEEMWDVVCDTWKISDVNVA